MFKLYVLFTTGAATLVAPALTAQETGPANAASSAAPAVISTAAAANPCADCDPAPPPTVPPDTIVLNIDGQAYTAAEFDRVIAAIVPPATPISTAVRRRVAEILTEMRLLSAEAVRQGLDRDSRVQQSLALARDQALGQAVVYHIFEGILENEARASYEANIDGYEQIKARHILIRTPDSPVPVAPGKSPLTDEQAKARAEEIRNRLLKGEDFATIAAEMSEDTNASRGGVLPRFRRMQMMPEFENAAFELRAGEISAPVKTVFGYHIIQVLEREPAPYDRVKGDIARRIQGGIFEKFLQELKQAHPATLNESYFGPPVPESPAPASLLIPRGS